MKKLTVIILLKFVFFITNGFNQVKDLEYDFASKEIKKNNDVLKHNNNYRIKIININKKYFKVTNNTTQSDFNTEMPSIFKGIALPANLNLGLPAATNEAIQMSDNSNIEITPLIKELNKLKIIENNYKKFLALKSLDNEVNNLYNDCANTYTTIEMDLISTINNYTAHSKKIRKEAINNLKTYITNYIDESINIKDTLSETINKIKGIITDSIAKLTISKLNHKKIIDDLKKIKNLSNEEKRRLENAISFLNTDSTKISSIIILNDSMKSVLTKADSMVSPMVKFKEENKIQALINNCNMINESNFTYIGPEIKLNSDELNIDLNIKSEVLLQCDKQSEVWIKNTHKTKGGVKLDFSSGVFINVGNEDFLGRDLEYLPSKTNDTTVTIKSKNGGNRALLSIGALMHIYCRSGKKANWALSPGLSTTTGLDGLNFHLGGSVLFGGKNRLGITVGLTFREVSILDRDYNEDTVYEKKKMPEKPPTIKVFPKTGGFLSFTYNFSKFKTE